ncbi:MULTISPECIES: sigma-70 family RNA polymerase sigma factor [Streptomyces]|uniref:sigma-70 family RNA polymerase sigma factor n=1 Tax=Streptomyces TaxID=1883 RepID=UPI00118CC422|nr:sigma-70 family RNA polymerase sigma factor [Streptomyces murinus]MBA9048668.1 RNA polymerase sigma-70 factor (ECF subfamily) [Streptomyces murinus]BBC93078.1 sigma-70 family RNA polymerase sigma factor [Streptomyces rochei]
MRNAPDVRGPTEPNDPPSTPPDPTPGTGPAPGPALESKPRRRLTAEQIEELGRLKPFLEGMVRQARMQYMLEDLVQSCVLQLVRAWSRPDFALDRRDGGRAFARKVMRDVIADAVRGRDRDLSSPVREFPEVPVEADEGEHAREVRLKAIDRFLAEKLTERLYPVGRLAIVEGLSQAEIARCLKIDRHTVGRRFKDVCKALEPYKETIYDEVLGDVTS